MRVAGVDAAALDESSIGFRLAPRINASGRLGRPEAALDPASDRGCRRGEGARRGARDAEPRAADRRGADLARGDRQINAWPESRRRRRGYVVVGEGWHEGVIGIVASRLVERFNRPVVVIAGADREWKGSGRSVAAFDLHAGAGCVLGAPRALRWPPRRGRADDRGRADRDVRRGVRGALRRRC